MFGVDDIAAATIAAAAMQTAGGILSNNANAEMASDNRDWQERMSNTSYQRAVSDLQAAGLNPMLAYSKGGASTPGGAQATMTNPFEGASNTAIGYFNARSQRDQVNASTAKMNVETENLQLSGDLIRAQTAESTARASDAQASAALKASQIPLAASTVGLQSAQVDQIQVGMREILSRVDINHATIPKIRAEVNNLLANARLTTEQIKEVKPRIENLLSHARVNDANKGRILAEIPGLMNSARRTSALATIDELAIPGATNQANFDATSFGRAVPYLDQAGKVLSTASQVRRGSFYDPSPLAPFRYMGR